MKWIRLCLLRQRQSGQGTIEYLGVAVLISVLIASLAVTPVAPTLGTAIKDTVCKVAQPVLGGTCNSSEKHEHSPEDYMMECPVSAESRTKGTVEDVLYFSTHHGYTFKLTKYSDGTSTVEVVGYLGWGANLEATKLKLDDFVKLRSGLGADVTGSVGDVYEFDTWDEGEDFRSEIENITGRWWNHTNLGSFITLVRLANMDEVPRASTGSVEIDKWNEDGAGVDADKITGKIADRLGLGGEKGNKESSKNDASPSSDSKNDSKGNGWTSSDYDSSGKSDYKLPSNVYNALSVVNKLLPDMSGRIEDSDRLFWKRDRGENRDDPSDDTLTITLSDEIAQEGGAKGLFQDYGTNTSSASVFDLVLDTNYNLIGVRVTETEKHGSGMGDAKDDNNADVYVADFDLRDPESFERAVEYLAKSGGHLNLRDLAHGKLSGNADQQSALAEMLQDGTLKVNDRTVENINNADGFGLGGKIRGIGAGFDLEDMSSSSKVIDSHALVPDGNGGFERVKNTKCM